MKVKSNLALFFLAMKVSKACLGYAIYVFTHTLLQRPNNIFFIFTPSADMLYTFPKLDPTTQICVWIKVLLKRILMV
jgi:hypothetical protein